MEIKYSDKAAKQIRRIFKGDRKSTEMIFEALESYAENPSPGRFDIKTLKGQYGALKRLRVGDYRIIFEETGNVMFIYQVKHRREAYRD